MEPPDPIVDPAHDPVDQIEKRDERDEHGANVEREVKSVDCTARNGAEKIGFFFHFGHFHAASGKRLLSLGNEHLGHKQRAGGGHDDGGEKMLGFDTERDVGRHDAAGDVGHAAGHYHHQLGLCELIQERADGERSFGLPHEDAGGNVERFSAAGSHHAGHNPGGDANDNLHDADVVEQREKSGDENNCG